MTHCVPTSIPSRRLTKSTNLISFGPAAAAAEQTAWRGVKVKAEGTLTEATRRRRWVWVLFIIRALLVVLHLLRAPGAGSGSAGAPGAWAPGRQAASRRAPAGRQAHSRLSSSQLGARSRAPLLALARANDAARMQPVVARP